MANGDFKSKQISLGGNSIATLAKNEKAGACPVCSNTLIFEKGADEVFCNCCNQLIDTDEIACGLASIAAQEVGKSSRTAELALSIDSPESGRVYLEKFFEDYDWETYQTVSELGIEEIDGMVEKNRIKNGADSNAWILDFESKILPINKKLDGLIDVERKIASTYNSFDNTDALEAFDVYVRIARSIIENKKHFLKQMADDIEQAKKFGAGAATCDDMSNKLNSLKVRLTSLKAPKEISDLDAVKAVKEELDRKISMELAEKGIDAKAVYDEAIEKYEVSKADKSASLKLFESIRGYSDSIEYIASINKYFNYNYNLFCFFGKHFIFKKEGIALFNPNDTEEKEAQDTIIDNTPSYSLYEVVDGVPAEKPLFKGLTKLLHCYGNKLFYISKNKKLCCFDVFANQETILDEGVSGSYDAINRASNFFLADNGKAFFMRKRLELETAKKGCWNAIKRFFAALIGRKKKPVVRKDNYSVLYVNMANATSKTLVDGLIDITEYYDNQLFYITADDDPQSEATFFMVCDVLTGNSKKILDDTCEIHNVVDKKVIFTKWNPNDFNKDLYSLDLESGEKVLIEKNIYEYFASVKNKIFYTIGNDAYCPLYSNNTEGTDRCEVMQNVDSVACILGDWMYIVRGSFEDRNAALIKVSIDGKQAYVVCTQLQSIIKFTDSYIYYIDTNDVLHVVRNDGQNNISIAGDMSYENVIIGNDAIYYLRNEAVSKAKKAYSLYKMDLSGHNPRKLIFNVNSFKDYDKDTLYLMRNESVRFEITTPISAKKTNTDYKKYNITRYFKFDKNTEAISTVLSLGLPRTDKYEYKSGCLKRKVTVESSFREVPDKSEFKRRNIAAAGAVYNKQVADIEAQTAKK